MKDMKFPVFEKIQKLTNHAESLTSYWERYKTITNKESCDKYDATFNGDSRFIVFKLTANFSAHTGYYGNSGCTTYGSFEPKIIQKHFTKWLNKNKEMIFLELAKSITNERDSLIKDANAEILEAAETIRQLIDATSD